MRFFKISQIKTIYQKFNGKKSIIIYLNNNKILYFFFFFFGKPWTFIRLEINYSVTNTLALSWAIILSTTGGGVQNLGLTRYSLLLLLLLLLLYTSLFSFNYIIEVIFF